MMNYEEFSEVVKKLTNEEFINVIEKSKYFTFYGKRNNENLGSATADALGISSVIKFNFDGFNLNEDYITSYYNAISNRNHIFTFNEATDFGFLEELFEDVKDNQEIMDFLIDYSVVGEDGGYDVVQNSRGKYNFMYDGVILFDTWFDEVSEICEESHAFATKDGKHYELWFDPSCLENPSKNYWEIKMRK